MILTAHPFPAMMKTSTTGYNTIPHVLCRENENGNEKKRGKGSDVSSMGMVNYCSHKKGCALLPRRGIMNNNRKMPSECIEGIKNSSDTSKLLLFFCFYPDQKGESRRRGKKNGEMGRNRSLANNFRSRTTC